MKIFVLAIAVTLLTSTDSISQDVTFPRELTNEGSVLTMYQPQVDESEQYKIHNYRMAFSLKPAGGKEAIGVLYMKAATDLNMDEHNVLINKMSVTKTNLPSLDDESAENMGKIVRSFLSPHRSLVMSVEQIVASMPKKESAATITVNNNPPVIFMSKKPTILNGIKDAKF